jgi:3-hydroxyacyl-CoA dehydrogenase
LLAEGLQDIGERLRGPFRDAAEAVFLYGSTPWEVDEAMEAFGFARGPFEAEDIIGLDRAWARRQATGWPKGLPILGRMMELGKLGRISGAGWYRYPGGGGKVDDPIVADLALEEAHFHRLTRVDYSIAEITERVIVGLIDGAADLSAQGVPAALIDRASVEVLGFPAGKGGVFRYATSQDPEALRAMVARVRDEGFVPLRRASAVSDLHLFDS